MDARDIEQETKAFVEALDAALVDSKAHFTSHDVDPAVISQWLLSNQSPVLLARHLMANPPIPSPAPPPPLASTVANAVFSTPKPIETVCPKCNCPDYEYTLAPNGNIPGLAVILALIFCFPVGIILAIAAGTSSKTKNKKKCKNCGWARDN